MNETAEKSISGLTTLEIEKDIEGLRNIIGRHEVRRKVLAELLTDTQQNLAVWNGELYRLQGELNNRRKYGRPEG